MEYCMKCGTMLEEIVTVEEGLLGYRCPICNEEWEKKTHRESDDFLMKKVLELEKRVKELENGLGVEVKT
ncbi:MAG: hypothetical protein ACTSR3_01230 [Candidatus Helarchaeota archaeon]